MKAFSEDGLDLARLKDGRHSWDFSLGADFFSHFEHSSLKKGQLKVDFDLHKVEHVFQAELRLQGQVFTACDNCLEEIPIAIGDSINFVIKLTDEQREDDQDREVYYIVRNDGKFYLSTHIYDLIYLGLPIKKTCEDPGNSEHCNIGLLDKMDTINENNNEDEGTDPRWDKLKDLL